MKAGQRGFSVVELLVVLAIISILMALYLPILSRVMGKAKDTAAKEGLRQQYLGDAADNANGGAQNKPLPRRDQCRDSFRTQVDTGTQDAWFTKLEYVVTNDAEFEAYWNTLINPDATELLYFENRAVFVQDFDGTGYFLPVIEGIEAANDDFGRVPLAWTYISTNLADTSSGNIGGEVLYSDGSVEYVRYPGAFPITRTVAELSHEFLHPSPSF